MAASPAPTESSLHPELLPLVPLLAVMWEDGIGSDDEVATLRSLGRDVGLADPVLGLLTSWTEPSAPPTPIELSRLIDRVREAELTDPNTAKASLTDLGLALREAELREAEGGEGPWSDPDAVQRLRDAEAALGILGAEAARRLLGTTTTVAAGPVVDDASPLPGTEEAPDPTAIRDALDTEYRAVRDRMLSLLERSELRIPLGLPSNEYRERVLSALRVLAEEGIGALAYDLEYGGGGDPGASVAAFETLAFGDLSVLVKFGVQFGLFGGSIQQLGTERHHEALLRDVGSLALPGCYAMTETGHGSNVRDLETTATYEPGTHELVVHSPSEASGKDWIGNAACHGRLAVVFARLLVSGEDHGVHALLVPIRSGDGSVLPGVRIEDRGEKLGLNGVDNGRIWFEQVRVPAQNLLDRFATIDTDGRYESPIPSPGRRFFTMLSTLVAGRVSVASAAVGATKVGLTIAVRHTAERRQFGPEGGAEVPLLAYTTMQRALMPRLASTYALHFAVRDLQARFHAWATSGKDDPELEARAAGLKAWATDACSDTLAACREACGGRGYLAENRFAALKADTDVFTTFEGANAVLYQLTAKGLLSRYRDRMGSLDLRGTLRWLGERAEASMASLNPVVTRRTDRDHLLDPGFHRAALTYREDRLLRSVAMRMRARLRDGMDSFRAVNEVQDHLIALARAHTERLILHAFQAGVDRTTDEVLRSAFRRLCALFALARIEHDRGWFLEAGYLEAGKSRAIRGLVTELCTRTSAMGPELVDGFGIPEPLLPPLVRR